MFNVVIMQSFSCHYDKCVLMFDSVGIFKYLAGIFKYLAVIVILKYLAVIEIFKYLATLFKAHSLSLFSF